MSKNAHRRAMIVIVSAFCMSMLFVPVHQAVSAAALLF